MGNSQTIHGALVGKEIITEERIPTLAKRFPNLTPVPRPFAPTVVQALIGLLVRDHLVLSPAHGVSDARQMAVTASVGAVTKRLQDCDETLGPIPY